MTGPPPSSPGIPLPAEGDDLGVVAALNAAAANWEHGSYDDALQWLQHAVGLAVECGHGPRAHELNDVADQIAQALQGPLPANPYEGVSETVEAAAVAAGSIPPPAQPAAAPKPARKREASEAPAPKRRPPFAAYKARARAHPASMAPPKPTQRGTRPEVPDVEIAPLSEAPAVEVGESDAPAIEYGQSELPAAEISQSEPARIAGVHRVAEPLPGPEAPDIEFRQSFLPEDIAAMAAQADAARASQAAVPEPPEPEPEPEPEPPPSAPPESSPVSLGGVNLGAVPGLEDLPDEAQAAFAKRAHLETLGVGEEVGSFAVALVLRGWVDIMPMIADCACARAKEGQVIFTEGTLDESIPLRVVAGENPTLVAVWEADALAEATNSCPWVDEELREVADRFQALAGAVMGELGDRLDDALRLQVTDGCELRALLPREAVIQQGDTVDGMYIVGGGRIELVTGEGDGAELEDELGPGDFVFGYLVPGAGVAPQTARAGPRGALVLYASRHQTNEMMMMVPTLLEILAS